jgi:cell division control protein 7
MARQKGVRVSEIAIHEDPPEDAVEHASDLDETEEDTGSDSELSQADEHMSDEEIEEAVAEDIERFESTFEGISDRYRLINRIGEGKLSPSGTARRQHA